MAQIKPFRGIRPTVSLAHRVAALPYDVYSREEAYKEVQKDELTFLRIDRAETFFDSSVDTYDDRVYEKAREILDQMIKDHVFVQDQEEYYYIYELIMNGRSQTGIVACASIDDYTNQVIKKHENTRADKEIDRIRHVDTCNAQTGPIFLAYRSQTIINDIVENKKAEAPLYHFISEDQVEHNVWCINETECIQKIQEAFLQIQSIYIADGHHRAASAVKVGLKRREEHPLYNGTEEFNYFLSVLFPHDQLMILPYNRCVKDLNGYTIEEFLHKISEVFQVMPYGKEPFAPSKKGEFGMYLNEEWYILTLNKDIMIAEDPVSGLDVSILQTYLLEPVLGIDDPRTNQRIDFIGGIRGLGELERRVSNDMKVAFSMYPTSIQELFQVSDAGLLMPPKSTWFEPKLRSGLFIHQLD